MILATEFNIWWELLAVFGGLGIFLYGINLMGDSLKEVAGDKMKIIIEKTTNTPLKGILVGAGVTALIQSSSATTALAVGLVRAGLMSFPQAVGVIMGANIGTTITAFIIGLKIEKYALLFIGIGAVLIFFFKKPKIKEIGKIILGFGMLFFGLSTMGDALKRILEQYNDQAMRLFETFSNYPILGLIIGTVLTAGIQSSSATIGILQTLYNTGKISLLGALPILLGSNIGTTITAIFAAIGGGVAAKRTAVVHTLFNVLGAILFMILLRWAYVPFIDLIETKFLTPITGDESPAMSIAIAHMTFNVVSTFILFFFIKQMIRIAKKIVKDDPNNNENILNELLDYTLIEKSPVLAFEFAKKSIIYMGNQVIDFFDLVKEYSFKNISNVSEKASEYEKNINSLDKRIHDYLINLTATALDHKESRLLSKYLDTIKDLERIGDHCSNITEFFVERYESTQFLTEDGSKDLEKMYDTLEMMVKTSIISLPIFDKSSAQNVINAEESVDEMEETFRIKHIERVNKGICTYSNSDHYLDILSNLERIGDHCHNIANNIIAEEYCQFDEFNH